MPSEAVIDPSVAAKWYLPDEEHRERAEWLRLAVKQGRLALLVPEFWPYEVASVFSKAVSNGRLSLEAARLALESLLDTPRTEIAPPDPLHAFDAARRFNRSVIDSFYLVIAETRGCEFWTDDRKLVRSVSAAHPFVRWIGDYPDPAPP